VEGRVWQRSLNESTHDGCHPLAERVAADDWFPAGAAEWLTTEQSRIPMFADETDGTIQNRDEAARVAEMLLLILS